MMWPDEQIVEKRYMWVRPGVMHMFCKPETWKKFGPDLPYLVEMILSILTVFSLIHLTIATDPRPLTEAGKIFIIVLLHILYANMLLELYFVWMSLKNSRYYKDKKNIYKKSLLLAFWILAMSLIAYLTVILVY